MFAQYSIIILSSFVLNSLSSYAAEPKASEAVKTPRGCFRPIRGENSSSSSASAAASEPQLKSSADSVSLETNLNNSGAASAACIEVPHTLPEDDESDSENINPKQNINPKLIDLSNSLKTINLILANSPGNTKLLEFKRNMERAFSKIMRADGANSKKYCELSSKNSHDEFIKFSIDWIIQFKKDLAAADSDSEEDQLLEDIELLESMVKRVRSDEAERKASSQGGVLQPK